MYPSFSVLRRAALISAWAMLLASPVTAQITSSTSPAKTGHNWRVSPTLGLDTEYDDNVFLLPPSRIGDVVAPSAAAVQSGRYAGMEKASDLIATLSAAFQLKGPGIAGRTLSLTPEIDYELYTQNSDRSSATLRLSLEQDLWADSRFRLQGIMTPHYFAKNYLADAVDGDGSGSITPDERVYARGEYREGELSADYRVRLAKSTKRHLFGAALQLGGGYYRRSYDAPFSGRDIHGPTAGAKVLLDLSPRISFNVEYEFASLSAAPTDQVLLLNEADFGQDFNGNGSLVDPDVRVLTPVDHSRKEHNLAGTLRFELSKTVDIELDYAHRWRRYSSDEALDVTYRGRRDARSQVGAELGFRISKALRLRLGGVRSAQRLNRAGDPGATGDVDDYTRHQGRLGLSYDF